jgi:hypothetical protein
MCQARQASQSRTTIPVYACTTAPAAINPW